MKKENLQIFKAAGLALALMLALNYLYGYLSSVYAQTSDTVTASVTIGDVLTISDDGVNLSIASLTPGSADTTQSNILTVASNSATGFNVTIDVEDIQSSPVAGQLSDDASGTNIFDADSSSSYIEMTSAAVGSLTGTYETTGANIGDSGATVLSSTDTPDGSGSDSQIDVDYEVFADTSITPTTYQGTITFTIASGT